MRLMELLGFSNVGASRREVTLNDCSKLRESEYLTSHLPTDISVYPGVRQDVVKILFNYRDPRDVCVSTLDFYDWRCKPSAYQEVEFLREAYRNCFRTRGELLTSIIKADPFSTSPFDLNWYYRSRSLLFHPKVQNIRFEDLVGSKGGGDDELQRETIANVCCYLGLQDPDLDFLAENVYWKDAKTFNRGTIGRWKREFEDAHIELFNSLHSDLLAQYGYK